MARSLDIAVETWPLANAFVISRGAKTEARVVVATVSEAGFSGRGECVPYARYGESVDSVVRQIRGFGVPQSREALQLMPAGAARNALDCALWDLAAKRAGKSVAELLGRPPVAAVETCFTLSLDTPEAMAEAARKVPQLRLLKLKLGGAGDIERMEAVRRARPDAGLVADANEAWTAGMLAPFLAVAAACRYEVIEQPLPSSADEMLEGFDPPVTLCADESAHTREGLDRLARRYQAVNIKLDKTGGLTEALAMADAARARGLKIMVGSMVSTSLAMAPAMLLAGNADWADLDSPLLLARDRRHGLAVHGGWISPPEAALWG